MSLIEIFADEQKIVFSYPFNPFYKPIRIYSKEMEKNKIHFTESLIDLGTPNTIALEGKGGARQIP